MKRCAELTAKSVSFFRKAIIQRKRGLKIISIGTTFLVCGFFYLCLAHNKNLDKPNFLQKPKNLFEKMSEKTIPSVYAKNKTTEIKITSVCNPEFIAKNSRESQINFIPSFCENKLFDSTEETILETLLTEKEEAHEALRKELSNILTDTPMEEMIDPILKQEKTVAAFLVGIAFKESKFGVYSPKKNGKNCYNYWGFKGKTNPTSGGYSCFSNPEEAITVVGKRLSKLSIEAGRTKPSQMTVWKCGSSCATHSPQSVQKWIADVSIFYNKIEYLKI